ncbi:type I-G CRISPR-associated helicase/endonuclease Cas3g [Sphaerisporangium fuscum]|uniref:type I-G CRISPR-associated helicase/endonuclease Cas3g n=1 Tax=Sphaerisporangium fuscum TaxID=2835868 RepID=UPI002029A274|nr:type I-U CRISPR-associated helicase/endonuclease Cas3 [Sphaerisporangium fuscum]
MNELTAADFPAFLWEVHGRKPFPWQQRLVEGMLTDGRWPDVLDVPTGLGKTTMIDIAVFVAAAGVACARRRMFFVVDRRLVVDEAYDHASALAQALAEPPGPISAHVAQALRQKGDDGPALQVTRMRGGVTWSWRWLERPDRYAVVVGTVDQIGSRLLFRGYQVGQHLRPIDAALTGTDSLIVIDEAHLAEPLVKTIRSTLTVDCPQIRVGAQPTLITMSATTPPAEGQRVHRADTDEQDQVARERLAAPRRLHLLAPEVTKKNADVVVATTMATWAKALAGDAQSGRVVAVVCNSVGRARAVHTLLQSTDADVELLIGRSRPIDREYLLKRCYPRMKVGRSRTSGRPLIVCATQTIEVGANIDADHLVTESASLAALIQRLGRLNRLGKLMRADAVVIHDGSVGPDDPVYGPARQATWQWLSTLTTPLESDHLGEGLDVSPLALRALLEPVAPAARQTMREPLPYMPVLFGQVLDAWVRTSPIPHPDPPVAPYLHGIDRGSADVAVVWRSGLAGANPQGWPATVMEVPPSTEEAVEVSLHAVRQWLSEDQPTGPLGDVEGTPEGEGVPSHTWRLEHVVRYRGRDDATLISPGEIRPGDLIVVPCEQGGCDEYGWNPASTYPVLDVADLAYRGGRPVVRLGPAVLDAAHRESPSIGQALRDLIDQTRAELADDTPPAVGVYRKELQRIIDLLPSDDLDDPLPLTRNLRALTRCAITFTEKAPYVALLTAKGGAWVGDADAWSSSVTGQGKQMSLLAHEHAVANRAEEFALNLGLEPVLINSVRAAALWHDEGKRDPRFQAMLHGRPPRVLRSGTHRELLAKSGLDPADRAAHRRAKLISGYPDGMRHEALSARITRLYLEIGSYDVDPDLVIHLVAAHHGRSRPLLPPVTDPAPETVQLDELPATLGTEETLDWDAPRRFAELNQRYGRWGLALLECIVRLADIWCSEREEEATL